MMTKRLRASLPYIMDLDTGISSPRDPMLANSAREGAPREAIRRRAYARWEYEGRPGNRGLANWLAAETELEPASAMRVRGIPAVRLDPLPGENPPLAPSAATAAGAIARDTGGEGPSPLCREAEGDDVLDYAFHLYVQSGCAAELKPECWREANRCLDARIPAKANGRAREGAPAALGGGQALDQPQMGKSRRFRP